MSERWIVCIVCCVETKNIKTYSYLTDDNEEKKNGKGTRNSMIKRKLKFGDNEHCLEATQLEIKQTNYKK